MAQMAEFSGYGDCLSWWSDDTGFNVTVQTAMKYAPVTLIRTGDSIKITGYVAFTGDKSNETYDNGTTTYAQMAMNGIENFWSSSLTGEDYLINGKTVTVDTTLVDITNNTSSHRYFNIAISKNSNSDPDIFTNNEWGYTKYGTKWSVSNYMTIYLFQDVKYKGGEFFTLSEDTFKRIAAHEFGHILGIDDAYPGDDRPAASVVLETDMMYSEYNGFPLSGWDLAMATQAYTENKWQYWENYSGNKQSKIISSYNCSK